MPEYRVTNHEVYRALAGLWPWARHLGAALNDETSRGRYLVEPLETLTLPRSITQREASYRRHARRLAGQAAKGALERAGIAARAIDLVIAVSCTGFMIPSLDVFLVEDLGLRPDVARLPVAQWGCAGGVAGLARAHDWLRAYPSAHALLVAVELPSLTFQPTDSSWDNLVSSLVFGDGAAAAVLAGDAAGGLAIEQAAEVLLPETTHLLGFDLRDGGFHVVLDRDLAGKLAALLPAAIGPLVQRWSGDGLAFAVLHAGGSRILEGMSRSLGLPEALLASSRQVFDEYGNTSSAAILLALEREMPPGPAGPGLAIGVGPGVSVQLLKLRR